MGSEANPVSYSVGKRNSSGGGGGEQEGLEADQLAIRTELKMIGALPPLPIYLHDLHEDKFTCILQFM
jgi:hypothetical protein